MTGRVFTIARSVRIMTRRVMMQVAMTTGQSKHACQG